jgi:hypothetical protein
MRRPASEVVEQRMMPRLPSARDLSSVEKADLIVMCTSSLASKYTLVDILFLSSRDKSTRHKTRGERVGKIFTIVSG